MAPPVHPQLQVLAKGVAEASPENFFGSVVPRLMESQQAYVRRWGGRYGFIVKEDGTEHGQWVVDFDAQRVWGGIEALDVDTSSDLSAVVEMSPAQFGRRGGHDSPVLREGSMEQLLPFIVLLRGRGDG